MIEIFPMIPLIRIYSHFTCFGCQSAVNFNKNMPCNILPSYNTFFIIFQAKPNVEREKNRNYELPTWLETTICGVPFLLLLLLLLLLLKKKTLKSHDICKAVDLLYLSIKLKCAIVFHIKFLEIGFGWNRLWALNIGVNLSTFHVIRSNTVCHVVCLKCIVVCLCVFFLYNIPSIKKNLMSDFFLLLRSLAVSLSFCLSILMFPR